MTAGAVTMTDAASPVPVPVAKYEERAFGFWLYLMSDAIIFALLFATYAVMLGNTAGGPTGNELFNLERAAGETALLLLSSATFGFATVAMAWSEKSRTLLWLLVTVALGCGFLFLEIGEFRGLVTQGAGPDRSGFLSAFFTLVGTHGLHVSIGLLWIVVMIGQLVVKGLTAPVVSRMARLGLFWHFLDIVWVGIFSVVYLPGLL
jgi:cytochrome o ubiquinol oxidase subunit III